MASSGFEESNEINRWFCHRCELEVKPSLPDYTCSRCGDGFIEPVQNQESSDVAGSSSLEVSMDTLDNESIPTATTGDTLSSHEAILRRPMRRGVRRTHIQVHRIPIQSIGTQNIQGFLEQLMVGLSGGGGRAGGALNIQVTPLMMTDGLDNIITMLMNQADGAGPPPAPKDQIDALPSVIVVQEQVDKNLQCHVCMEDFQLEESVRSLPCRHLYHGHCIVPWLELHGTCPICRRTIDKVSNEPAAEHMDNQNV